MKLEDEADMLVAERHQLLIRHARDVDLADAHLAAVGPIESAEDVQQRALPDARGAHHRHHLALLNGHIQIAQHVQPAPLQRIRLVEPANLDKGHRYS